MKAILPLTLAALSLAACDVTPMTEETPVNMVEFQNGVMVRVETRGPNTIVCQDYWQGFTQWDHAVAWPAHMTSEDANLVCRSKEQLALEAPTSRPWEPVFNSKRNVYDPNLAASANASAGSFDVRAVQPMADPVVEPAVEPLVN